MGHNANPQQHPEHRCREAAGSVWTCRAHNCRYHARPVLQASDVCNTSQPRPRWYCNRERPPCPGHSQPEQFHPEHHCNETLSQAEEQAAQQCDARRAPGNPLQPCPTNDQIRLIELAEWVQLRDGSWETRPATGRNQFINMTEERGHPDLGRRIRLKARVEWVSGDHGRTLNGQTVYWYLQAGANNRAGLTGALQSGFNSSGSGLQRITATTDQNGWTSPVEFYLSQYGGDTFEVWATENPNYSGGLGTGNYTVWRRLFYEVDCMKRPGERVVTYESRLDAGAFEQKFRDVYIDPHRVGTDAHPSHRRLLQSTDASSWAQTVRNGDQHHRPRYFHLLLVDSVGNSPTQQTRTYTLPNSSGRIELSAQNFEIDPSNWFYQARFTQGTNTGPLPREAFNLVEEGSAAAGDDKYVITLNPDFIQDTGGWPVPTSVPGVRYGRSGIRLNDSITIELTFWSFNGLSGLQTGVSTFVAIRWRERTFGAASPSNRTTNLSNSVLNTILHEAGHAMGLAASTLPDGNTNGNYVLHPLFPNDTRLGPHCTHNTHGCIMFSDNMWSNDPNNSPSVAFCPNCVVSARGRNLASLPVRGTDPY